MLFYQPDIDLGSFFLSEDESRHVIRVLRYENGNVLDLTNGKGSFFNVRITKADAHKCLFEIVERKDVLKKKYVIHIAIAPTKNADRIEWFVEKSVEIDRKIRCCGCVFDCVHHLLFNPTLNRN